MGERLARQEYRKHYYEKNKVKLSRYCLESYLPRKIKEIHEQVPEQVELLYRQYPFEIYGDPIICKRLRNIRIQEHQLAYQECYDAGMEAYLYSIHRCALCGYEHVEHYIRKMISLAVIWALNIYDEGRSICEWNKLRRVEIDAD